MIPLIKTRTHPKLSVWVALFSIIFLVILRLALVRIVILEPWRGILVDSEQYLELANQLLQDGTYGSSTNPILDLFRTPGYPGFLSIVLGMTGGSLRAVVITQICLVLMTAFLLFNLGKSSGNEKVGFIASILFLISPNSLFWSVTIMTETLFSLGLTLAFVWTVKATKGRFPGWGIGLLLGILTLVRPIGIFLILIWTIWFLLFNLRRLGILSSVKMAAGLILASAIVLIPWYCRNYARHGRFTLSNVNRVTLYSYHLAHTLVEEREITLEQAKAEITEMGGVNTAAPKIILAYPLTFGRVQLQGIARTVLGSESETWLWLVSENENTHLGNGLLEPLLRFDFSIFLERFKSIISDDTYPSILLFFWGVGYTLILIPLSLTGVIMGLSREIIAMRGLIVLGLLIMAYLILSPGAAGEARFRVPLEPLLAFFAALTFINKSNDVLRRSAIS